MLEGEQRTGDKRLTELVTEVTCTVRCLDENLLRSLIQPFANRQNVLPWTTAVKTWISSHVDSCSSYRP